MNKPEITAEAINSKDAVRRTSATFIYQIDKLEKAANRIIASADHDGGNEPAAVAWLLKFLSDDLVTLKSWQQEEAQWDVARFSLDGGQGVLDYGSKANWGMGAFGLKYPETAADWLATLQELQQVCREVLGAYLSRGEGIFPIVAGSLCIFNKESSPRYRGDDLASGFYYLAAQLLSKYGHRVKYCEGCMRLMLVGRKDQRFHSQSCQVASFFRAKRAKDKAARLAKEAAKKLRKKKRLASQKGGRHGAKR